MARAPVFLNVYDMFWLNDYASTIGVGVFHSGIEVYGTEYAYGGHPFPFSGIFENAPRDSEELGDNFRFKESICLGQTDFSPEDVRKMIQQLGHEYRGDRYHLITKNCNHFSNHLSKTLTGQELPSWINRLANISGSLPFLERWIPQEWLTPIALQQSLDRDARQSQSSHGNGGPTTTGVHANPNAVMNRAGMNTAAIRVNNNRGAAANGEENGQQAEKSSSSTSTARNGTKSTQSWRWFQRRNGGSGNNDSSQNGSSSVSAPVTSRQPHGESSSSNGMSPTLSRIWSSLKGNTNGTSSSSSSATTTSASTTTSSSSTATSSAKNNN